MLSRTFADAKTLSKSLASILTMCRASFVALFRSSSVAAFYGVRYAASRPMPRLALGVDVGNDH